MLYLKEQEKVWQHITVQKADIDRLFGIVNVALPTLTVGPLTTTLTLGKALPVGTAMEAMGLVAVRIIILDIVREAKVRLENFLIQRVASVMNQRCSAKESTQTLRDMAKVKRVISRERAGSPRAASIK